MEPDNIVVELLRSIRQVQDSHSDDLRELKGRMGILEAQYASLSNRLDRLDDRVARIERRLELSDA